MLPFQRCIYSIVFQRKSQHFLEFSKKRVKNATKNEGLRETLAGRFRHLSERPLLLPDVDRRPALGVLRRENPASRDRRIRRCGEPGRTSRLGEQLAELDLRDLLAQYARLGVRTHARNMAADIGESVGTVRRPALGVRHTLHALRRAVLGTHRGPLEKPLETNDVVAPLLRAVDLLDPRLGRGNARVSVPRLPRNARDRYIATTASNRNIKLHRFVAIAIEREYLPHEPARLRERRDAPVLLHSARTGVVPRKREDEIPLEAVKEIAQVLRTRSDVLPWVEAISHPEIACGAGHQLHAARSALRRNRLWITAGLDENHALDERWVHAVLLGRDANEVIGAESPTRELHRQVEFGINRIQGREFRGPVGKRRPPAAVGVLRPRWRSRDTDAHNEKNSNTKTVFLHRLLLLWAWVECATPTYND